MSFFKCEIFYRKQTYAYAFASQVLFLDSFSERNALRGKRISGLSILAQICHVRPVVVGVNTILNHRKMI